MPPQLGAAPAQVVVPSFEVVEIESQSGLSRSAWAAIRLKPDSTKEDEREDDDRD